MKTSKQFKVEEAKRCLLSRPLLFLKIKQKLIKKLPVRMLNQLGILFNPSEVAFGLSGKCNMRCVMCEHGSSTYGDAIEGNLRMIKNGEELGLEKNIRLLDETASLKPNLVTIGVGEPFLYKDIITFLEQVYKKRLLIKIYTNGTMLEQYAEKLVSLGVYEIDVSLDGLEKAHDTIRGSKGAFKKAVKGLKKIAELKKKYETLFPKLVVNFTISSKNYDQIDKFVDQLSKEDIDSICIFHLFYFRTRKMIVEQISKHPSYNIANTNPLSIYAGLIDIKKLDSKIGYVKNRYKDYNIYFVPGIFGEELKSYYNKPESFIKRGRCKYPWSKISIMPNGEATVQYRCVNTPLGDVKKSSIKKIWAGESFKKLRKELYSHKDFPICSRCCGAMVSF